MRKNEKAHITSEEMGQVLLMFAAFLVHNYGFHTKTLNAEGKPMLLRPTPLALVEQWQKAMEEGWKDKRKHDA